jgi:hypothetical protein
MDLTDSPEPDFLGFEVPLPDEDRRFVADSQAIYSYEGTREVNTLSVGRAVTGLGAVA